MKTWLISNGWWSEDKDNQLITAYRKEILEALKAQEKRPPPSINCLISDVYKTPPTHLLEQFSELQKHIKQYPDHYLQCSTSDKGVSLPASIDV